MNTEEKKLTDEEALKAVEICHTVGLHCSTCPAYKYEADNCDNIAGLALVDYCHRLQGDNKRLSLIAGMINKGVAVEIVNIQETIDTQKAEIERLTRELQNLDWYKMWHKKFKKEIDDLTLELETYRPTKLSGNGQCKCSICGGVSWTDWFSRYKGKTICDGCLKEIISTEEKQSVKDTAKEITSKVVDLNIICGDDFRLFLDNFELWVKERYGVEVE